jgi:threonine/homoserine/homoserine lactone efflux protein
MKKLLMYVVGFIIIIVVLFLVLHLVGVFFTIIKILIVLYLVYLVINGFIKMFGKKDKK